MPAKRFWRCVIMLTALAPTGCQAFCDRWAPCHAPSAYPSYPAQAGCVPCTPPAPQCCPAGYQPTNAYQQGWAVPQSQTRLSPNCCE